MHRLFGLCLKNMCSFIPKCLLYFKRKPIKSQSVIPDIKKYFFCFVYICYNHTSVLKKCDLLVYRFCYSSHLMVVLNIVFSVYECKDTNFL